MISSNSLQFFSFILQVPIKDCTPSDLTSLHTISRDVNAGFAGEVDQESVWRDCFYYTHLIIIFSIRY